MSESTIFWQKHQGTLGINCTTLNDKPCADGVHVRSKMNTKGTFGGHGMGGGDTNASLSENNLGNRIRTPIGS